MPHLFKPTTCRLLAEDPDLADAIAAPARRGEATEHCVVPCVRLPRGRWDGAEGTGEDFGGIGLLVLEGLLLRRVGVKGRFGAELLGEGDLLRPWDDHTSTLLTPTIGWRVLQEARLAVLDGEAARCLADYPELTGRLVGRAVARSRHLALNMAIVHQARVDIRLCMLFWHLAGRWGRVTRDGIILPLTLTHAVLADLVAARRPTVTTALAELTRRGVLESVSAGWLLYGDPPGELLAFESPTVSGAPLP